MTTYDKTNTRKGVYIGKDKNFGKILTKLQSLQQTIVKVKEEKLNFGKILTKQMKK